MKNKNIKKQELIEMINNKQISNCTMIKRTWSEKQYLKYNEIDNKLYVYDKNKKEIMDCWLDLDFKLELENEKFEIIGD